MVRTRIRTPEPQLLLHRPRLLHSDTWQEIGHEVIPQASASTMGGQAMPWSPAGVTMVRARWRCPVPHVAEQEPQLPQLDTSQSIGQSLPQSSESVSDGHAGAPYCDGATIDLVRVVVPGSWPQTVVHMSNGPHAETTHSTGHEAEEHVPPSVRVGQLKPL